jgi:hypothetical protein
MAAIMRRGASRAQTTTSGEQMAPGEPVSYELKPHRLGSRGETILFLHGEFGAGNGERFLCELARTSLLEGYGS